MNKSIPQGYHSVNIYLSIKGADEAISFYQKAFGAYEKSRYNMPDGKVMYAELQIGDSTLQVSDEFPEHEARLASPLSLGATSCIIHLYVEDVDAVFASAVNAGASVRRPLEDMFWGDRYGQVEDPFGHIWSLSTRVKQVTQDELKAYAAQLAKQE